VLSSWSWSFVFYEEEEQPPSLSLPFLFQLFFVSRRHGVFSTFCYYCWHCNDQQVHTNFSLSMPRYHKQSNNISGNIVDSSSQLSKKQQHDDYSRYCYCYRSQIDEQYNHILHEDNPNGIISCSTHIFDVIVVGVIVIVIVIIVR